MNSHDFDISRATTITELDAITRAVAADADLSEEEIESLAGLIITKGGEINSK